MADVAVALILTAPLDRQVEMLKAIMCRYVDRLIEGFPDLTEEEVRTNATNYHQAIKSRIAEIAMGECVGSA